MGRRTRSSLSQPMRRRFVRTCSGRWQKCRNRLSNWFLPVSWSATLTRHRCSSRSRIMIGSRELHTVPTQVVPVEQFVGNGWLAESLKTYYAYHCQICWHSFQPTYGAEYAKTYHIQYLSQCGPDVSTNMVVICPNHHRIIHETYAAFNRHLLTYEYPNGLREPLLRPDHFQ